MFLAPPRILSPRGSPAPSGPFAPAPAAGLDSTSRAGAEAAARRINAYWRRLGLDPEARTGEAVWVDGKNITVTPIVTNMRNGVPTRRWTGPLDRGEGHDG